VCVCVCVHVCLIVCVHCAVTTMSDQVPTITDTTVCQPVDSEDVSSTANTTGRFIEGPHVSAHGVIRMRSGYKISWCDLVLQ
jgi:hypothetical protein